MKKLKLPVAIKKFGAINYRRPIIIVVSLVMIFAFAGSLGDGMLNNLSQNGKVNTKDNLPKIQAAGYALRPDLGVGINLHLVGGTANAANQAKAIKELDMVKSLGTDWVRVDIGWASFEYGGKWATSPGATPTLDGIGYNNDFKFFVQEANKRGLKIMATLTDSPPYAQGSCGSVRCVPVNNQDYADFAKWFANQYDGNHTVGKVDAIEIWNEPTSKVFMQGVTDTPAARAAAYAGIVKAAYPAIKSVNANMSVVVGATEYNDYAFIDLLYQNGIKNYCDIISVHPYQAPADKPPSYKPTNPDPWSFSWIGKTAQVMDSYGDTAKKIWLTEFSWSAHPNAGGEANYQLGVTEQQQGDYWVDALKLASDDTSLSRIANTFWFQLYPYASSLGGTQEVNQGILYSKKFIDNPAVSKYPSTATTDYQVRPAYTIMKDFLAASYGTGAPITPVPPADTTPPTISITSPTTGTTVSGTIAIAANAADNIGISKVDFYIESTLIGSDTSAPYSISLDTKTKPDATYKLYAKAFDAAGNKTAATGTPSININNTAPVAKAGDMSGDGLINVSDLSFLLSKWGTADKTADLNKNGIVDVSDLSMLLSNWGK